MPPLLPDSIHSSRIPVLIPRLRATRAGIVVCNFPVMVEINAGSRAIFTMPNYIPGVRFIRNCSLVPGKAKTRANRPNAIFRILASHSRDLTEGK